MKSEHPTLFVLVSGASAVLCMSPTHSGGFVSGGADGVVRVWDENLAAKGATINIVSQASILDRECLSQGGGGLDTIIFQFQFDDLSLPALAIHVHFAVKAPRTPAFLEMWSPGQFARSWVGCRKPPPYNAPDAYIAVNRRVFYCSSSEVQPRATTGERNAV